MALFRKFFLKKTPDRLLEISERVYGIMLSPLGRAGSCGRVGFAGVLHVLQQDFPAPAWFWGFRILVKYLFIGVQLSWNLAHLEAGLLTISS